MPQPPPAAGAPAAATDVHVVVLAAGKGTRMRSAVPKVLHQAAGLTLLDWVLRLARSLEPKSITAIVGHGAQAVEASVSAPDVRFVRQEPQLGTGHALLQARALLEGASGRVLLLSGDVPLLSAASVRRLLDVQRDGAALVVATADMADPAEYGRIVREGGELARIVEHRDASPDERRITEINSGVYAFDVAPLFATLAGLGAANAQREYYLPDLVAAYRREGRRVAAVKLDDADEIRGINTRLELADVSQVLRRRINDGHMAGGVTLVDPATAYIGPDVVIGTDTVVQPYVFLEGGTVIGSGCEIHAGARISDSVLGDRVTVYNHTVVTASRVADGASIGPFARIRPESDLAEDVHVGNFVEVKKSTLGRGTKVGHLSYLGDSSIGAGVNIGAGTITCNYDGQRKHRTEVGDGAFVGSDSTLVAPVKIGAGAYVAAGSSITEDVPDGALGIARGRQSNKPGWARARAEKTGTRKR
jgi:bifunctional UDP-N-acetylglucosamine pyrophosphorylase/glucosamine-1-phosphate N-acetyltransferase